MMKSSSRKCVVCSDDVHFVNFAITALMKGVYTCKTCGEKYEISSSKNAALIFFIFYMINLIIFLSIKGTFEEFLYLFLMLSGILIYLTIKFRRIFPKR